MRRMDFNGFTGNWPFFRVRSNTVEKLAQLHQRCGIEGGFVSSLEAIFYQDPYEAELQLSRQLKGSAYMHAMVLNPTLPGWKDDLKRAAQQLNIKAVRLVPGFQGYALTDPALEEVMANLREYGLPLIITLRMRDERTMWMIQPESIPVEDLPPTPTPTLPYATPTPSPMPRVPAGVQFIDGKWVYVDEYGVPLSGVPLTGDNTNFVLWGCAIVLPLLVAALAAVEIRRRKRRMATEGREE